MKKLSLSFFAVMLIVLGMTSGAQAHPLDELLGQFSNITSSFDTFNEFIYLGFTHILPLGLDHILFVLGLFLLNPAWRPLLWQVTAFTIAHTITLGMSIFGLVSLPGYIVEPIIALSITFIAIENIVTTDLKPWRPIVVFVFGLIHGLGFAGVLMELGLPEGQEWIALVAFNIGVEFGQLAVIALALAAVWFFRKESWYRSRVTIPASVAIGAVGLFWFVERVGLSL